MSVIGSVEPTVKIAQKEPYFIGWRKRPGANSNDFEHYHAPCLQFVGNGASTRVVTALYPSNSGKVAIKEIVATCDVNDTDIKLIFEDETVAVIDENDYSCYENVVMVE